MAKWDRGQITTTGANGSASGTGTFQLRDGILMRIRIPSNAAVPASTDVTVNMIPPDGGTVIPLVVFSNVTVPFNAVVQVPTVNATGAATGNYAYPGTDGNLQVVLAQANAGTIDVWFLIE